MVKGRLPRESNPLPGDKSGFVASHDTTGAEDYKRTSPLNPLPVKSIGDSNVKDAAVKAELELIKQSIADNKATNDLILARLDNPIDTQLTGSIVEHIDITDLVGTIAPGATKTLNLTAPIYRGFAKANIAFRRSAGGISKIEIQSGVPTYSIVVGSLIEEIPTLSPSTTVNITEKKELFTTQFYLHITSTDGVDFKPLGVSLFLWRE